MTSSRIALNCAMISWHITEWIYNEFHDKLITRYKSLALFQNNIKKACPSLQIMHDLANGTKHYSLTRHKPIVKQTKFHKGSFKSGDFSRDFDISSLDIELNDGTKIYFEDELKKQLYFGKTICILNLK